MSGLHLGLFLLANDVPVTGSLFTLCLPFLFFVWVSVAGAWAWGRFVGRGPVERVFGNSRVSVRRWAGRKPGARPWMA